MLGTGSHALYSNLIFTAALQSSHQCPHFTDREGETGHAQSPV